MFEIDYARGLLALQHELLLFAAVFFAIGLIDELAVDAIYAWNRLAGRVRTPRVDEAELQTDRLSGTSAVFIPAWRESAVIGATLSHALAVWPQRELRIYVGCYRNDPATIASAMAAAAGDRRVRIVIVGEDGPTSKSHCLNRLYQALTVDEARSGSRAHMVVLHDAEDMVDPAAMPLLDRAVWDYDFVQLPVMALPPSDSRWVASHYSDEFAESHAKAMVVRQLLGAAIPGAGVGCAIRRGMLDQLASEGSAKPFPEGCLTEDYEIGLRIGALGGKSKFLRLRTDSGRLISTRAYFPDQLALAVRQKTRWVHGIALQGWDRLGWQGSLRQRWMTLRDRRGPFAAMLIAIAYLLVALGAIIHFASHMGVVEPIQSSPALTLLLWLTSLGFVWRLIMRAVFTAREYGLQQGLLAVPRALVSNVIAIMSARRALAAYVRFLRGEAVTWDKTEHSAHPVLGPAREQLA